MCWIVDDVVGLERKRWSWKNGLERWTKEKGFCVEEFLCIYRTLQAAQSGQESQYTLYPT